MIDSWMGKLCASLSVIALVGGCAPKADDSNSGTLAFGGVGVPIVCCEQWFWLSLYILVH